MTGAETTASDAAAAAPVIRLESGNPTPEELAVVTALLATAGGGGDPTPPRAPSPWVDRSRALRNPLSHSPGGWHASGLPR